MEIEEEARHSYRLHTLAMAVGLSNAVWQHGSGKWACMVPVRGLSAAALPNRAGGHLKGTASLSVRLWQ